MLTEQADNVVLSMCILHNFLLTPTNARRLQMEEIVWEEIPYKGYGVIVSLREFPTQEIVKLRQLRQESSITRSHGTATFQNWMNSRTDNRVGLHAVPTTSSKAHHMMWHGCCDRVFSKPELAVYGAGRCAERQPAVEHSEKIGCALEHAVPPATLPSQSQPAQALKHLIATAVSHHVVCW